jgi:hypothetical protein
MTNSKDLYAQLHPHAGYLQVSPVPREFMPRVRQHCKETGITIRQFVLETLTSALDAAEKKAGKR